jgi:hypothetical protein
MDKAKAEHAELKQIAAFLVSAEKKNYATLIYDLARIKQGEIRKIEKILDETQIEI